MGAAWLLSEVLVRYFDRGVEYLRVGALADATKKQGHPKSLRKLSPVSRAKKLFETFEKRMKIRKKYVTIIKVCGNAHPNPSAYFYGVIEWTLLKKLSEEFPSVRADHVRNIVGLIDEGNTIPFIARYRKEMTGSLRRPGPARAGRAAAISAQSGKAQGGSLQIHLRAGEDDGRIAERHRCRRDSDRGRGLVPSV